MEDHPPRGEVVVVVAADPGDRASDAVDEAAARALAQALLGEGLRPSRAAKEVARRLRVPRNLAYGIVQDLAEAD
jgi:16S rRNA C1402 (ribose-2'-O) methylase RsmI